MNDPSFIIQNRLREATVSLERADFIACDESWRCDASMPPFSSIGLILGGEGTLCVNGVPMCPHRGQLYLLPAKTSQTFFTDLKDPFRIYYCHFEVTCDETDLFELIRLPLCLDAKEPDRAEAILRQMSAACRGTDILSALKTKQLLLDLLALYLECCPPDSVSLVEHNFDSPLSDAISYVESHLDQAVTVQQMAEIAGYHPSHFTRLFQERMGISPGQFVLRKRTERAEELLTATSLPVSAIADTLGFGSQFYFSNFFKKQTSMTPTLYRRLYMRAHV
ncbi:MAG: AraC family transcriptional regulator [Eubacteriales bacterium]|nr:AraC family transcriptional regulator [Eubacteriales bacterium]